MEKFPIYGGPLSGAEAENAATVYCDRDDVLPLSKPRIALA